MDDAGSLGRAFDSPIPAQVVIGPIAVVLAIGQVVLGFVADQVVQGESIVAGDEVDARLGRAPGRLIQIAASGKPGGEVPYLSRIAPPKLPHGIAILVVP